MLCYTIQGWVQLTPCLDLPITPLHLPVLLFSFRLLNSLMLLCLHILWQMRTPHSLFTSSLSLHVWNFLLPSPRKLLNTPICSGVCIEGCGAVIPVTFLLIASAGICAMCGKQILDTANYRQSSA